MNGIWNDTYYIVQYMKDFPEMMISTIGMKYPNEDICIHQGSFELIWKSVSYSINGKLILKWLPKLSFHFYGKEFPISDYLPFETDLRIEIKSKEPIFHNKGIISKIIKKEEYNIVCYLVSPIEIGNKNLNVDFVRFEIANLKNILGTPVKIGNARAKNRITLKTSEYKITLDKDFDFIKLNHQLKETGGYQILYTGKLEYNSNKKIPFDKANQIFELLSYFLQFVNGRRTSPIFRYGFDKEDKIVWKTIDRHFIDSYKYVLSWFSDNETKGILNLWEEFTNLWKNESDRDCLKTILHWYVEANANNGFAEGSIVLIQNAHELLFHWLISEKYNYVNTTDADNISASAKIGFLLSLFNINPAIPPEFESLIKFSLQYNIINGPEAFTRIRNCIVHPSIKKRKSLKEIEENARVEALHLGIYYVEIVLLNFLKYNGEIKNRCKSLKNKDDKEYI